MFDLHSDILIDLYNRKDEEKHVLSQHLANLKLGNIDKAFWALCLINEDKRDIDEVVKYVLEIIENVDYDYILGFEGLSHINDLSHLQTLFNKGFKYASLTWNERNKYGTGCKGEQYLGLSDNGIEIIRWMAKNKMIIDLAHANKKTFYDVVKLSNVPFMVSHTCCESLCSHPRNIDNHQLKIIRERKGIVGITNVRPFLSKKEPVVIDDLIEHIIHAISVVGIDYVGVGFDFMDYLGSGTEDMWNLPELYSAKDSRLVIDKLKEYGFNNNEILKITDRNAENFINRTL